MINDEQHLIRASRVVVRAGLLSLSAGTGSYRVKDSMRRIAHAVGIERHQAFVTLTEITSTSHRGDSFRTEAAETRLVGVNAARLQSVQQLADQLESADEVTVDQVAAALSEIEKHTPLYPAPLNALFAGMACAALSFLIGGGPAEIIGALLGAASGQLVRRTLTHRRFNQLGVTMLAAAAASGVYLAVAAAAEALLGVSGVQAGYIAAVLFLIPGFPLVTAGLDFARLDLSAGIARLSYAVLLTMSAGLVVWVVSILVDLTPANLDPTELAPALLVTLRLVAGFIGAASFALMFNGTVRMAAIAGLCCMIANTVRLELVDAGGLPQTAAAAAALIVGLLSGMLAPRLRIPRITVSVPAVLIMIPGAVVYHAIYAASQGDAAGAIGYAIQAILTIAALPFGLAVSRMLTDRAWAFDR